MIVVVMCTGPKSNELLSLGKKRRKGREQRNDDKTLHPLASRESQKLGARAAASGHPFGWAGLDSEVVTTIVTRSKARTNSPRL